MAQHSDKSQEAIILKYLQTGRSITQVQAAKRWNIWRLSARIKQLRYRGFNILTERVRTKKGYFGRYWLFVGTRPVNED